MNPVYRDQILALVFLTLVLITWNSYYQQQWILFYISLTLTSFLFTYIMRTRKPREGRASQEGDACDNLRTRLVNAKFVVQSLSPLSSEYKEGFRYRVFCDSDLQRMEDEEQDPILVIKRVVAKTAQEISLGKDSDLPFGDDSKILSALESVAEDYQLDYKILGPNIENDGLLVSYLVGFKERPKTA